MSYLASLTVGAMFGAALTSAGVYHPSVIIGQMKFEDFTMLKAFLTATALSASIIPIAIANGFTEISPRSASSIGWFSRYDANIIGGLLLGVGMSLTGACPGTVLPQIATGVGSSLFVGIGGIIGAKLFEVFVAKQVTQGEGPTVHGKLGIYELGPKTAYQLICYFIVTCAAYFVPGNTKYLVPPSTGGLLIGGSQALNLFLTGNGLGVSGAYGSIAHLLMSAFKSGNTTEKRDYGSVAFVAGALLGSWILSQIAAPLPLAPSIDISMAQALIGGGLLIFGARLGGGCTSGHGITGMSQLSVSSFITVAAMFGGGMTWSILLG